MRFLIIALFFTTFNACHSQVTVLKTEALISNNKIISETDFESYNKSGRMLNWGWITYERLYTVNLIYNENGLLIKEVTTSERYNNTNLISKHPI